MTDPTCASCGKTHSSLGNPVEHATRGKYKGWCRSCRAKADRERRAAQNTSPCKKCGRTHSRTGAPLELPKSGRWAGLCVACRRATRLAEKKPAPTTGGDHNLRAYQNYIAQRRARIARKERIKAHAA